jgi:hypothetical protein
MTSHRLGADAAAIPRNNTFDFILSQLISELCLSHSFQSYNRHTPFPMLIYSARASDSL